MKQLWTVIVFASILLMPTTYSPTISETTVVMSLPAELTYERIYGNLVVEEIYQAIASSELRTIVQKFSENGSRYIEGEPEVDREGPNKEARYYIIRQLENLSMGRIEIEVFGDYFNVIGRLPGYLPGDNPVFAITAHYDSPSGCPGANCNGAGIASMLVLAKVLSQYKWPLDIYFMAFNGLYPHGQEMKDFLEGSEEVSIEFKHRGIEILALFNIDTILYPDPSASLDEQVLMGYDGIGDYSRGQYWAELTKTISNNYGLNYIAPVPSYSFPLWYVTDHYPFFEREFSGILCAFESGSAVDPSYQRSTDISTNPTFRYDICKEVSAAIGGSIAYVMGRTYGEPRKFEFSFILQYGRSERFYIPISTSTNIEVTCRWFGGPATFRIQNPAHEILEIAEFNTTSAWEFTEVFNESVTDRGLYTLTITSSENYAVGFELAYSYDSDIDHNGILDSKEFWMDLRLFGIDEDADGISAAEELFLGTSDNNIDSDSDSMDDKYEVDNGLNPTDPSDGTADFDGDTLSNSEEYSLGLNPWNADSDLDQMPDNWELEYGLNPLVNDADQDPDEDGKSNLDEFLSGSNPQVAEKDNVVIPWFVPLSIIIVSLIIVISWIFYQESKMF